MYVCLHIMPPFPSVHFKCAGGACVRNNLARKRLLVATKVADPVTSSGSSGRDVPLHSGLTLTQHLLHKALVEPMEPAETDADTNS